jgi:hypothetical protein
MAIIVKTLPTNEIALAMNKEYRGSELRAFAAVSGCMMRSACLQPYFYN